MKYGNTAIYLNLLILLLSIISLWIVYEGISFYFLALYIVPSILLSIATSLITNSNSSDSSIFPIFQSKPLKYKVKLKSNKGNIYINDLRLGVCITGSMGSGKTKSVFYPIFKHFADHHYTGILYDHKDFELTEMIYPLYKDSDIKFHCFSPLDVNRSVRLNPIAPEYITNEKILMSIISTLTTNLLNEDVNHSSSEAKYFRSGAESLLCATIWRFKEDYPEYCSLPYVITFLLNGEHHQTKLIQPSNPKAQPYTETHFYKNLVDFISESPRAKALASQFIAQKENPKEISAVFGTLTSSFRILQDPAFFYLLSGNDISLAVNDPNNKSVISFVSAPGTSSTAVTHIISTLLQSTIDAMSKHGREDSFIALDEAPRIKIPDLGSAVSVLRSFGVVFVYGFQDMVQTHTATGGKPYIIKEVINNLSTKLIGRANDSETAKYYENLFENIDVDTKSINTSAKDLFGTDTRTTISKRQKKRIEAHEFTQLRQGEFVLVSNNREKVFLKLPHITTELPPQIRNITTDELETNYVSILQKTIIY